MDRDERARRRAAFSRPREAVERARSLAHALELEEEAEREEAALAPRPRRRTTGRFVATAAIVVFVVSSIGLLAVLVDRYEAQAFMRYHGVATQAVIIDKTHGDWLPKTRAGYGVEFRFWPRSSAGRPAGSGVDGYQPVSWNQFAAISVGQNLTVRYNPRRLSQYTIYFGPPPTDRQIIVGDLLLFGVWVVLFGGICAVIVGVAWPEHPASLRPARRRPGLRSSAWRQRLGR
jgi:hypothetical protein